MRQDEDYFDNRYRRDRYDGDNEQFVQQSRGNNFRNSIKFDGLYQYNKVNHSVE
jgi:hypothetical protein